MIVNTSEGHGGTLAAIHDLEPVCEDAKREPRRPNVIMKDLTLKFVCDPKVCVILKFVCNFSYSTTHPDDAPNSAYGTSGNFVFDVPGCTGCGIHSGRESSTDRAGQSGVNYATNGCIRTTDEATSLLRQLTRSGDTPSRLTVER